MLYRIVITVAVVAVFLFAVSRTHDAAPPTITAPASDEPNMKGLQIN